MFLIKVCDATSFLNGDMDFPVGISHEDENRDLPKYRREIRDRARDLVDNDSLLLGCDANIIRNKTIAGTFSFFFHDFHQFWVQSDGERVLPKYGKDIGALRLKALQDLTDSPGWFQAIIDDIVQNPDSGYMWNHCESHKIKLVVLGKHTVTSMNCL